MNAGLLLALFPFVLPWDDSSPGLTDLSSWNREPEAVVARDGHFYDGNQRIRFFGVNLVGPGAFPRHDESDTIAARMAKFGINCVRRHHIDADGWSPMFKNGQFNPDALDKLDYLIAQLKRRGIYVNLNLLTLRKFKP